jgi:septal ring factor EnvC (AmiA/AmiB activator)
MSQPIINKNISLGTILSLATILTTLAFAWGQFNTRMSVTEAAISRLEEQTVALDDFQRLEDQLDRISPRLRQVEQKISAQDATLDRILETLVDIRARLDRRAMPSTPIFPNSQ